MVSSFITFRYTSSVGVGWSITLDQIEIVGWKLKLLKEFYICLMVSTSSDEYSFEVLLVEVLLVGKLFTFF